MNILIRLKRIFIVSSCCKGQNEINIHHDKQSKGSDDLKEDHV